MKPNKGQGSLFDIITSRFKKVEEAVEPEESSGFYGKQDLGIETGKTERYSHRMDLWEIGVLAIEVILVIYTLLVLLNILPFF